MLKCFKSQIMFESSLCISISIYRCFYVEMLRWSLQSCTSFEDRISVTNCTDLILLKSKKWPNDKYYVHSFRFLFSDGPLLTDAQLQRRQLLNTIYLFNYLHYFLPQVIQLHAWIDVQLIDYNIQNQSWQHWTKYTTIFLNRDVDIQITYYL